VVEEPKGTLGLLPNGDELLAPNEKPVLAAAGLFPKGDPPKPNADLGLVVFSVVVLSLSDACELPNGLAAKVVGFGNNEDVNRAAFGADDSGADAGAGGLLVPTDEPKDNGVEAAEGMPFENPKMFLVAGALVVLESVLLAVPPFANEPNVVGGVGMDGNVGADDLAGPERPDASDEDDAEAEAFAEVADS
jgi:hypothetical protein